MMMLRKAMIDGEEVEYEFCCAFEYKEKPWDNIAFLGIGKIHTLNGQKVHDDREMYFYGYRKDSE